MEHQQDSEIHQRAAARAAVAAQIGTQIAAHAAPADMTLDEAQQELGDLRYEVTAEDGSIVADLTKGRHYAVVTVNQGLDHLVTQWFSEHPDGPRKMTGQHWPGTVAAAVQCARDVAAAVALAHAADERQAQAAMVPPIIGDQLEVEYAGKHREPEPAQDGAEPESAVTS